MLRPKRLAFVPLVLLCSQPLIAGPYAPINGQPGSTAIGANSPSIVNWASGVASLTRGPEEIEDPFSLLASHGTAASALGPAEGNHFNVISLGDGGRITLTFPKPITDGPGFDLAVFENGFEDLTNPAPDDPAAVHFLELAFVEVSSNGVNFFRFPAVSLTQTDYQLGPFDTLNPTNLHNLAGKYHVGFGTPFDLADLAGVSPLLNISQVTHVRIIDVVGSIDPPYATYDSLGNPINDPFGTFGATSGFDLDGVAVLHEYTPPAPSPDLNGDTLIDIFDFMILQQHFGLSSNATPAQGDLNSDGRVNRADYLLFRQALTPSSPLLAIIPIPSPGAAWPLAGFALASLVHRRKRSKN